MNVPEANLDAQVDLQGCRPTRTRCRVLFCNRTRRLECEVIIEEGRTVYYPVEWLCAIHWPIIPKVIKQRHIKAKRAFRRNPSAETANEELEAWGACVTAAHEAAAGI
jgi:hypothetical protein